MPLDGSLNLGIYFLLRFTSGIAKLISKSRSLDPRLQFPKMLVPEHAWGGSKAKTTKPEVVLVVWSNNWKNLIGQNQHGT